MLQYMRITILLCVKMAFACLFLTVSSVEADESLQAGINLLIADFINDTGDPDLAYRIKPVLAQTLQQSDRLAVYPEIKARRFLEENFESPDAGLTLPRARQLCLRENIQVILLPGINRLDGSLIVSARLIHIEDNRELFVDTLRVKDLKHLAVTIENLSRRIRQSLGETADSPAMSGNVFPTETPFDTLELFSKSLAFYGYKDQGDSIACLHKILERNPGLAAAHLYLGQLYFRLQKPREALLSVTKANDYGEKLPLKYRYLIDGLDDILKHRYIEAADHFRSYTNAFPLDWQAFDLFGRCAAALGLYPAAIEAFEKSVALDGTRLEPRINLGLAFLYNRDSVRARSILQEAALLAPEDPENRIALGLLELVENNPRYAIELFEKTRQQPLYRSRSTMLLAQADIYRGKFTNALEILATGIEEDRKFGDAVAEASKRLARAQIFQLMGHSAGAVAECLEIPDDIDDPVLIAEQGAIFAGAGRPADAGTRLQKLRSVPTSPFIQSLVDRLLGEIQSAEGRLKEAQQSFLRAADYSKAPSVSLARILTLTEQSERAAQEYSAIREQKAAILFPYNRPWFTGTWVQALFDAGRSSLQSNDSSEAKQYFRQYLWVMDSADPSFERPEIAEILLTEKSR